MFPSQQKEISKREINDKIDYICDYEECGKKSTSYSKLKRHKLTHEKGPGYRCEFKNCNSMFTRSDNLKKH